MAYLESLSEQVEVVGTIVGDTTVGIIVEGARKGSGDGRLLGVVVGPNVGSAEGA